MKTAQVSYRKSNYAKYQNTFHFQIPELSHFQIIPIFASLNTIICNFQNKKSSEERN